MKRLIILLICVWFLSFSSALGKEMSAEEIAWAVYNRPVGKDSESYVRMLLIDAKGRQKERRMYVAVLDTKKVRKTFIRFLSPKDIAGTGFLALAYTNGKEEQFLYLPALRRTRRIAGSFRFHRFVNSDFTYEDLERHHPQKYLYQLLGEEIYKGSPCYLLKTWPKKRKDSAYGWWIQWITKDSFLPVKVEYYDHQGRICKRFLAFEWKKIQGYWTVMRSEMADLKKNHKTVLIVEQIRYDLGLDKKIFTRRNLAHW